MGLARLEAQDLEKMYGLADASAGLTVITSSLRRVIDAGLPDYVPAAASALARDSERAGDVDMARVALRAAMDFADSPDVCHAVSLRPSAGGRPVP